MANTFLNREDIINRMLIGTDESIHPEAQIVRTENDYWVAWHDGLAAVLSPDAEANSPCDWVEGAATLEDLVIWIEGGEYAAMDDFDGSEDEWNELVLDSEAHGQETEHEHSHDCACHHH